MSRELLVALGLVLALVLAALVGVERAGGRRPDADVPRDAVLHAEPALPSAFETGDVEPSASPALTR
jgi:hypothetical protein